MPDFATKNPIVVSILFTPVLSKDTHTCAGKRGTSKYRCSLAPPHFHGVVVIIL